MGRPHALVARPVRRVREPGYPTRLEVAMQPGLLQRHAPAAWRRSLGASGLSFLLAGTGVVGCGSEPDSAKVPVVAPLFVHGDGQGAFGCVVMSPPIFLSEEEALQIVEDRLAARGLSFPERDILLDDVRMPQRTVEWVSNRKIIDFIEKWTGIEWDDGSTFPYQEVIVESESVPVEADLKDPERRVVLEYVSYTDYFELGGASSGSTVQDFDFTSVARELGQRAELQCTEEVFFAVFYDPMCSFERSDYPDDHGDVEQAWEKATEAARGRSRQALEAQLEDFMSWLEGQGVL